MNVPILALVVLSCACAFQVGASKGEPGRMAMWEAAVALCQVGEAAIWAAEGQPVFAAFILPFAAYWLWRAWRHRRRGSAR